MRIEDLRRSLEAIAADVPVDVAAGRRSVARRARRRRVGLGAAAVIATMVLLFGVVAAVRPSRSDRRVLAGPAPASSNPVAVLLSDGTIEVRSPDDGHVLRTIHDDKLAPGERAVALSLTSNGILGYIAVQAGDGTCAERSVDLVSLLGPKQVRLVTGGSPAAGPGDGQLVYGQGCEDVVVGYPGNPDARTVARLPGLRRLAWSANGARLLASDGNDVVVVDAGASTVGPPITGQDGAFDGADSIAVVRGGRIVQVGLTGRQERTLLTAGGDIDQLDADANGNLLYVVKGRVFRWSAGRSVAVSDLPVTAVSVRWLPPPPPPLSGDNVAPARTVVSAALRGNDVYALSAPSQEGTTTVGVMLTRYDRATGAVAASRAIEGIEVVADADADAVWVVDATGISELDSQTLATTRTFGLGGAPIRLAAHGDVVYVVTNQAQLVRVTPSTGQTNVVQESIGVIGDVAFDPGGQRLYVAAGQQVLRLDPRSGKVLARSADVQSTVEGVGIISVDSTGEWVNFPGGMMSSSLRLRATDLRPATTVIQLADRRFGNRPYVIANGASFWLVGEVEPRVVACGDTASGALGATEVVPSPGQLLADSHGVVVVGPDGISTAAALAGCG